ncbi:hypothetical protein [Parabacteroides gordonii]|jgi:hypothetical protein|uniref:hypothetical protein n=1 Tax=Parabacteroides gordonii TaxID=574930 RepID=UPI000EDABCBE|nr:hypothetical protein [Parabacteroides gordonii]RGP17273.1 hypothetical protein DXB27_07385 [Parabacteroides gordonii]
MKKKAVDYKKYKKQKIDTYVSVEDVSRLRLICEKYGFNSIYQLLQYLVHCFLRVADPVNDPIDEPMPIEIEEMFTDNAEWEKRKPSKGNHNGMNIRQKPDQRKIKTPDDI